MKLGHQNTYQIVSTLVNFVPQFSATPIMTEEKDCIATAVRFGTGTFAALCSPGFGGSALSEQRTAECLGTG